MSIRRATPAEEFNRQLQQEAWTKGAAAWHAVRARESNPYGKLSAPEQHAAWDDGWVYASE